MPYFHFDITDSQGDLIVDNEGVDFADSAAMEHEAMRAAGTMVSELAKFPQEPWMMVIRDDKQRTVATLTFAAR